MALKNIRVVELGGLAPAPFCGMVLADHGANVIRVNRIGEKIVADPLANGKKIIGINLKSPKGVDVFRKLCKTSDVIIEPFRKGVMEKLGLGPNVLLEDNPRLIYARLTGFGQSGYYSKMAGHDINYLAVSGLLSMIGRKNTNPTAPLNLAADFGGGGLMCAVGILLALLERSTSGCGQVIDANMVEGSAYLGSWVFRSQHLPFWGQARGHNMLDTGAPFYDTYETKDGKFMAVGALEPQFYDEFLKGLGLTHDETPQWGNFDENRDIFRKRFLSKTQREWCEIFDGTDACVTPVLTLSEASKHKHNDERKSFVSIENDNIAPEAAPRLERTPGKTLSTVSTPESGQHTIEILNMLKYSLSDIKFLIDEGIVETNKPLSKL